MYELPKELQEIAINELNEVPHRVAQDLNYFKEWLSQQRHITARDDDKWLLTVLRNCKWSLEKAKKQIDTFYSIKTALPEIFKHRDPFDAPVQHIFERNLVTVLPPSKMDSPVVIVVKGSRGDPNLLDMVNVIKFGTMLLDIIIREYPNFIVGAALLYDFKNLSPVYVKQMTPTVVKKLVTCIQIAYPSRVKGIYFVNVPNIFVFLFNSIKAHLPKKIVDRFHLFVDNGEYGIQDLIPLSILPADCGGQAPAMSSSQLQSMMESYRDWFVEEEQYGCDESKRPVTSKLDIDLFGIDGSFRKLDFD